MRVVVDANIVVAALINPGGWSAGEMQRADLHMIVPDHIRDEIMANAAELSEKGLLGEHLFLRRLEEVLRHCEVIPDARLARVARNELVRTAGRVDPDDEPYLAAFVAAKGDFLWTRDEALLDAFPAIAVTRVPGYDV